MARPRRYCHVSVWLLPEDKQAIIETGNAVSSFLRIGAIEKLYKIKEQQGEESFVFS